MPTKMRNENASSSPTTRKVGMGFFTPEQPPQLLPEICLRLFEIEFLDAGVEAFAFTFG